MKSIYRLSFSIPTKSLQYLGISTLSHQNPGAGYYNRRQEAEGRTVRVSVWWDFENCSLPLNTNVFKVAQGITNAVRANGIRGPIQISAFGDVMQISRTNQEFLSASGINLCHVPSGGKNSADRSLLVELMFWVSQNPPPAHIFLISGDRDFAGTLHKLRMNNYNILLASPSSAPSVLCSAATLMWQWSSLLKGHNLHGRLLNQPPDGPYNSWYGHFKASLEDPFTESTSLPAEESSELMSESQVRPIPQAFRKLVRQIVNSYPEGISISKFKLELSKSKLTMDRDLYGYKKLSRLLYAMPNDVTLHPSKKDQYIVKGVITKPPYVGEPEGGSSPQLNDETSSSDDIDENLLVPQIPERNLQELQKDERQHNCSSSVNAPKMEVKAYKKIPDSKKEHKSKEFAPKRNRQEIQEQDKKIILQELPMKIPISESEDPSSNGKKPVVGSIEVPASEYGIFRRMWMKWFASKDGEQSEKKREEMKSGKDTVEEKIAVSCESLKFISPALVSPSSHEALIDGKIPRGDGTVTDISSQGSSLLNKMTSWFKFWTSSEIDVKEKKSHAAIDRETVHSNQLELFSKSSFWNELESFISTSHGAALFTQSKTRDDLVGKLQKQGPVVFKSLSETDLHHLIDLLISHKKWVEECSSQAFPYRVTKPSEKVPSNRVTKPLEKAPGDNPPVGSNGLSNIFANGERNHQNPPHAGVQQNKVDRGFSSKRKSEVLADCHKLVDHIVKEHPEGINMGNFRKLFMERNGYALDLQKLGYEKLVNLLQTMPKVRIESNLLLPVKGDDKDSSFDELGPINNSDPGKWEPDATLNKKSQKGKPVELHLDYVPLDEQETSTQAEAPEPGSSSFIHILDMWQEKKKDETPCIDDSVEKVEDSCVHRTKFPGINNARKHNKSPKSYYFVVDDEGKRIDRQEEDKLIDNQDELVNDILNRLKQPSKTASNPPVLD